MRPGGRHRRFLWGISVILLAFGSTLFTAGGIWGGAIATAPDATPAPDTPAPTESRRLVILGTTILGDAPGPRMVYDFGWKEPEAPDPPGVHLREPMMEELFTPIDPERFRERVRSEEHAGPDGR